MVSLSSNVCDVVDILYYSILGFFLMCEASELPYALLIRVYLFYVHAVRRETSHIRSNFDSILLPESHYYISGIHITPSFVRTAGVGGLVDGLF